MTDTRWQWGIRYADGDIDDYSTKEDALQDLARAKHLVVARRGEDWRAYVGAELVCREIVAGDWTVADD